MARWMLSARKADFDTWATELHISPITARFIRNRGVVSIEEARAFLEESAGHDPYLLADGEKAARILLDKRNAAERVRIIGDYDVDGICSTYILKTGLTLAGFAADARLPERVKDGYGLNTALLDAAVEEGCYTVLTCDNGIAALKEADHAKAIGCTFIVTDHHEVAQDEDGRDIFPDAAAVIDPKRSDCAYPFDGICGAVVAYRLLQILFTEDLKAGTASYTREEADALLEELSVFTAIATICDVMVLTDENRSIVRKGLRRIGTSTNRGLRALIHVTGIEEKTIGTYQIGFILGPCLNASGRLDTATRALQLLEAERESDAVQLATDLKELNDSRKEMTIRASETAQEALAQDAENGQLPKIIVTYLADCHESIAGIVAGRLRETFHRPVIVLTDAASAEGSEPLIKGSGRSIPDYDMYEGLSKCADLFVKFGGHKAAAGMTLEKRNLEMLNNRLNASCPLAEEELTEVLHLDMELPFSYLTTALVHELECLEPYGNGNPKPLLVTRDVKLCSGRRIGRDAQYGKFTVEDATGTRRELMCFSDPADLLIFMEEHAEQRIKIVYEVQINTYRGEESVQLILKDYHTD